MVGGTLAIRRQYRPLSRPQPLREPLAHGVFRMSRGHAQTDLSLSVSSPSALSLRRHQTRVPTPTSRFVPFGRMITTEGWKSALGGAVTCGILLGVIEGTSDLAGRSSSLAMESNELELTDIRLPACPLSPIGAGALMQRYVSVPSVPSRTCSICVLTSSERCTITG